MSQDAELHCRCGAIQGRVKNASPRTVNRVVCYCDDCQAFLHHLGRADLLDANGGTDIIQVAPASLVYHSWNRAYRGTAPLPEGPVPVVRELLQDAAGKHRGPGHPLRGDRRAGLRGFGRWPRLHLRKADWSHFRPVRDRHGARGLYQVESVALCAGDTYGPRLAPERTDLAAPVLRPRDSRTESPADDSLARRARSAAPPLRSAPDRPCRCVISCASSPRSRKGSGPDA